MSLEERSEIGQITVLADGQIQVRRDDVILRDGEEISRAFHRHVLAPGDDLSNESQQVVTVANAVWTADIISAYKESHAIAD